MDTTKTNLSSLANTNEEQSKQIVELTNRLADIKVKTTGINSKQLRNIISSVLEYLEVENRKDWEKLLLLTVVTESCNGTYTRQIKGPAKSIFQFEPTTEKETLAWLNAKHKEFLKKLRTLRIPAHLSVHEGEYNMAYAIGLTYSIYKRKGVNPKDKNTLELAKIHKKYYNTYKGKATVEGTLAKLREYNVKL